MAPSSAAKPATAAAVNRLQDDRLGGAINFKTNSSPTENQPPQAAPPIRAPVGRAGNLARCANCDAALAPRRGSRRQKFCSGRCRDEARRARNYARFSATRYPNKGKPRSVQNRPLHSMDCRDVLADRPPRINAVPRAVIYREFFAGAEWVTVTSPDGVTCSVLPPRTPARAP
jgi:hypothetical protein